MKAESTSEDQAYRPPPWAAALDKKGVIYTVWGALDGLNLSYSMIKYANELLANNRAFAASISPDIFSPLPFLLKTLILALAALFSMGGNSFKEKDQVFLKSILAKIWPYIRDITKGLKNAYKGIRDFLKILSLAIPGTYFFGLLIPLGLFLGVFSAFCRMVIRYLVARRKRIMDLHKKRIKDLEEEGRELESKPKSYYGQSKREKILGFGLVGFGGVIDSFYLYLGVVVMVPLASPLFLAFSLCALVFITLQIINRVFEEYNYQKQVNILRVKAKLFSLFKQIEKIKEELHPGQGLSDQLQSLYQRFNRKKDKLEGLVRPSLFLNILQGFKNALPFYGVLISALLAVNTIVALAPAVMVVILAAINVIGLLSLAFFAYWAIKSAKFSHKNTAFPLVNAKTSLNASCEKIFFEKKAWSSFERSAKHLVTSDSSAPSFPERFEVGRSFFSGYNKGFKLIDYTLTVYQIDKERFKQLPLAAFITLVCCAVHVFIFTLRALARGFGKMPLNQLCLHATKKGANAKFLKEKKPGIDLESQVLSNTNLSKEKDTEAKEKPSLSPLMQPELQSKRKNKYLKKQGQVLLPCLTDKKEKITEVKGEVFLFRLNKKSVSAKKLVPAEPCKKLQPLVQERKLPPLATLDFEEDAQYKKSLPSLLHLSSESQSTSSSEQNLNVVKTPEATKTNPLINQGFFCAAFTENEAAKGFSSSMVGSF